jgi:two-component system, OmpR family, sensor kinase
VALLPGSLRGRLVLLFVLGTTAVVTFSSVAIYATLNAQIDRAVDDGLSSRVDDIAGALDLADPQIRADDAFALVLQPDGHVVAAAAAISQPTTVLTADELRRATTGPLIIDRPVKGLGRHARLLAQSEDIGSSRVVVVTGTSLGTLVAARARLVRILAVAGPLLVTVLGVGAWLVVGAALRPVRRMSRQAEEISRLDVGRRLPEPTSTELAELASTLNAMLDRLARAFEHERAFVDDASHELGTPIAMLRTELELAVDSNDVGELRDAVANALEETERLARLAEDILVLAREEAVRVPMRPEPVDLSALATRVVARFRDEARQNHTISVSGTAMAWADPRRTEQIVDNLLSNAARFARHHIGIVISDAGRQVRIAVADDGPGFPEPFLASAFDRFTQADSTRRRQGAGAGLGLAIVAALAEAQDGRVQARNGPPLGGAVVETELPAAEPAAR